MTLKELPIGKSATLTVVGGEGALRQHFLDMGLIPGADVTMVKYAPMGDPVELRIHSYELTLRLADAEKIEITDVRDEIKIKNQIPKEKIDHPGLGEGGKYHEKELLESCYRTSLELAKKYECESVAFPLISSGIYGYPKDQALKVAVDTIQVFLMEQELKVYLVIFDRNSYQISEKLFDDIASYIDDRYVEEHVDRAAEEARYLATEEEITREEDVFLKAVYPGKKKTLEEALKQLDESFSQMLLRKIDESGMTDAQCYKKANIDRKLFSKIRSDKFYKPSKTTVLAFALALELPLSEMQDMLQKAGFALSHSSKFDIIVEYFVEQGNYNVYEINEALFAFDQSLIGG